MFRHRLLRPAMLLTLAMCGVAWAAPPVATFLTLESFDADSGDTLKLHFAAGSSADAQRAAWPAGGVPWLYVRGGETQENRHDVRAERDDTVTVTLEHGGVTLLGADLQPTVGEMTGAELQAFVAQHLVDEALQKRVERAAADAKLRVRHMVSTKTMIRAAQESGPATSSAIGMSKTGQPAEIRPLVDPTRLVVGADFPMWTYLNFEKRAGVRVEATCVDTGESTTFVTRPGGIGHFRVTATGQWRVAVSYVEALEGDPEANWAIYTATLTFDIPRKGAR